ncbi:cytochrome p450 domain-containing protein [Phthorimaea operculella]|nr:cytochrome p450 domain-containing protein [Phthorimaea operculella]
MDVSSLGLTSAWILTFVASFLTIVLCWQKFRVHNYWRKRGVPYDNPVPFVGNLGFLMRKSCLEYFYDLRRRYPVDYVGVYLGSTPALVVQTPELARQVLVKDHEHFQDRHSYSDSVSDPIGALNLFSLKNPIWSQMRQEMSPMFTSSRLRMLTQLMNLNSKELINRIQKDHVDNSLPVKLKQLFTMYTSDTVGFTVFGLRVSVLSGRDSPLWTITRHMARWTFYRGFEFHCIFLWPVVAKFLRLKFFSEGATEYVKRLFWNVVEERKNSKTTNDKDLVNHLLKLKENLKLPAEADSELANNLMLAQAAVFIFGSVDTSSTTLSYCLHELAHHPEVQEKLFNEVNDALEQKGKEVLEYDDLMELKFLSACLYETLRKHPPVPFLDRMCNKQNDIQGVKIEPGVPVLVNVVAIHHDPRYWPEPEKWDPERPTATNDNDNVNYTFLPFGEGPRFCIGKRYGMMQTRAALAQLIHKFRMEPGPVPYKVQPDPYAVLLAPKNEGCVKFIPR